MNRQHNREVKHLMLEVLLILASVLIFWSGWSLLDNIFFFDKTSTAVITFAIGIIITLVVLGLLFKHEKYH